MLSIRTFCNNECKAILEINRVEIVQVKDNKVIITGAKDNTNGLY